jgi:hypothetical protein
MARGVICAAAAALVFLAGCANVDYLSFSFWQHDSAARNPSTSSGQQSARVLTFFSGNTDAVALRIQTSLKNMGLQANVTRDSQGVRITSVTKSGKRLGLLLQRDTATGVEQTKVDVEWADGMDNEVWTQLQLLAAVGPSH